MLPLRIVLAYITCALVWGTTWFAIRVCIGDGGYPTVEAAALRFGIAAGVLVPAVLIARVRLPRGRVQWTWLTIAGVLDAIGYLLVYLGEERVPGGLAAVLFGIQPVLLAVLLAISGLERVRPAAVAGALVSIVGVAVIFLDRAQVSPEQAVGVALVIGSVLASTTYSMIMKRHGHDLHWAAATSVFLGVTALTLAAVVLVRGPAPVAWPPPVAPTIALLYLAVFGSIVAFGSYFWLLRRLSLMATSTLVFVLPIISLAADALFERKIRLGGRAYLGVAITLSGLAVNLLLERRSAGRTSAPAETARRRTRR
jgi:drug/metabolite transporter (DMT)-like permease